MTGDDGQTAPAPWQPNSYRDWAAVMASHLRQALDGTMDAERVEAAVTEYDTWRLTAPRIPPTLSITQVAEVAKLRARNADLVLRVQGLITEATLLEHHLCEQSSQGIGKDDFVPAVRVDRLLDAIKPATEVE